MISGVVEVVVVILIVGAGVWWFSTDVADPSIQTDDSNRSED